MLEMLVILSPFLLLTVMAWAVILLSPANRRALLHREPFHYAKWGFPDLLIAIALLISCILFVALGAQLLLHGDLAADTPIDPHLAVFVCFPLSTLLFVLVASVVIKNPIRQNLLQLGLSLTCLFRDSVLAMLAAILTIPVVYLIQALITALPGMDYDHPTIQVLLKTKSPWVWSAAAFTIIIAAPIWEEFLFRGLIQGWIEKISHRYGRLPPGLPGQDSPLDIPGQEEAAVRSTPSIRTLHRVAPNLLTSALFAGVHWNHGGGWVALLAFSFALGFLYHKTHRLLPCILLHMALNSVSFGALFLASRFNLGGEAM